MNLPTTECLLRVWDESRGMHPIRRALHLLDATAPEVGRQAWLDAPVGRRDECLLDLHDMLFGEALDTVTRCPQCAEMLESSFRTPDIRSRATPASRPMLQFEAHDCCIGYRLPSSADLLAIGTVDDAATASRELLRRCVVHASIAGEPLDASRLPATLVAELCVQMAREDPSADIRISLTCPACRHAWDACFDIVPYLWSALDDWAQRVLADVHLLARAYGWSERDILCLSPARRHHYLELVRA